MWTWRITSAVSRDHADRVLLLDVGVEGVVERAEVRVADPLHIGLGIGHRVEEVALEAVERLDRQHEAGLRRDLGRRAMHLGGARLLVLGRAAAGEHRERLVERPAQELAAEHLRALDRPFEMVERARPARRIGADRAVRLVGQHGDRGAGEAMVRERAREPPEMRDLALEQRDLDAVVAARLELGQERQMLLADMGRPEQEIEAGPHASLPATAPPLPAGSPPPRGWQASSRPARAGSMPPLRGCRPRDL